MRIAYAATLVLGGFLAFSAPQAAHAASSIVLTRPEAPNIAPGARLDHVYWVWHGRHWPYRWHGGYFMHRRWWHGGWRYY